MGDTNPHVGFMLHGISSISWEDEHVRVGLLDFDPARRHYAACKDIGVKLVQCPMDAFMVSSSNHERNG